MLPGLVRTNSSVTSSESVNSVDLPIIWPKLHTRFGFVERLGNGGFGHIWKAKRISDDNFFAIKTVKLKEEDAENNRDEANMLAKLDHPNIVRYYDSWIEESTASENHSISESDESEDSYICFEGGFEEAENIKKSNNNEKYLLIQMELCGKSCLRAAIDNNLYLDEIRLSKYFREICEGLTFIHKKQIVHRDLKPENIFITSDDVIKIGDFGLSKQIEKLRSDSTLFTCSTSIVGTLKYIAPELHNRQSYNEKSDIYSLGVIYFEMCSEPMTSMEMSDEFFPLSLKKLKTRKFPAESSKKKLLIGNMVNPNYNQRPSGEDILKILNSHRSMDEIKQIINKSKRVSRPQVKAFKKVLKTQINDSKIDLTSFVTEIAVKIFQLHGGRNIVMPTFLPTFNGYYCENMTNMLNMHGNCVSVSTNSKTAFSHYVALNNITQLRRYSIGTVFDEGNFLPAEKQECVFEIINPIPRDFVDDAEMLYIAKEISDKIFRDEKNELRFVINHGYIYQTLLKNCQITGKSAAIFTNIMLSLSDFVAEFPATNSLLRQHNVIKLITVQGFSDKINTLMAVSSTPNITIAKEELSAKFKIKHKQLNKAFKQLKNITENANKFGIKMENIFVDPFLVTTKKSTGMMFKVTYKGKVVATGGRFEDLIKSCLKKSKRMDMKPMPGATEISLEMQNIVTLLHEFDSSLITTVNDIVIVSKNKADAIPIFQDLLSYEIKCEIVTDVSYINQIKLPRIVIKLVMEDLVDILSYKSSSSEWISIHRSSWRSYFALLLSVFR